MPICEKAIPRMPFLFAPEHVLIEKRRSRTLVSVVDSVGFLSEPAKFNAIPFPPPAPCRVILQIPVSGKVGTATSRIAKLISDGLGNVNSSMGQAAPVAAAEAPVARAREPMGNTGGRGLCGTCMRTKGSHLRKKATPITRVKCPECLGSYEITAPVRKLILLVEQLHTEGAWAVVDLGIPAGLESTGEYSRPAAREWTEAVELILKYIQDQFLTPGCLQAEVCSQVILADAVAKVIFENTSQKDTAFRSKRFNKLSTSTSWVTYDGSKDLLEVLYRRSFVGASDRLSDGVHTIGCEDQVKRWQVIGEDSGVVRTLGLALDALAWEGLNPDYEGVPDPKSLSALLWLASAGGVTLGALASDPIASALTGVDRQVDVLPTLRLLGVEINTHSFGQLSAVNVMSDTCRNDCMVVAVTEGAARVGGAEATVEWGASQGVVGAVIETPADLSSMANLACESTVGWRLACADTECAQLTWLARASSLQALVGASMLVAVGVLGWFFNTGSFHIMVALLFVDWLREEVGTGTHRRTHLSNCLAAYGLTHWLLVASLGMVEVVFSVGSTAGRGFGLAVSIFWSVLLVYNAYKIASLSRALRRLGLARGRRTFGDADKWRELLGERAPLALGLFQDTRCGDGRFHAIGPLKLSPLDSVVPLKLKQVGNTHVWPGECLSGRAEFVG